MTVSKAPSSIPRLHVISNDEVLAGADFPDRAMAVMEAGAGRVALHLRGPRTAGRKFFELARALAPPARQYGCFLTVNDRVDIALAVGIPRIHLGARSLSVEDARSLMPDAVIGASLGIRNWLQKSFALPYSSVRDPKAAHHTGMPNRRVEKPNRQGYRSRSANRLDDLADQRPDYVFAGNVFATGSHPGRPGAGWKAFQTLADRMSPLPVVAIGGILPGRAGDAAGYGGHGVAVLSGIWDADDPVHEVFSYIRSLEHIRSLEPGP